LKRRRFDPRLLLLALAWLVALWAQLTIRGCCDGPFRARSVGSQREHGSGRPGLPPLVALTAPAASSAPLRGGREVLSAGVFGVASAGGALASVELGELRIEPPEVGRRFVAVEGVADGWLWRFDRFGVGRLHAAAAGFDVRDARLELGEHAIAGVELEAKAIDLGEARAQAFEHWARIQVGFALLDQRERRLGSEAPAAARLCWQGGLPIEWNGQARELGARLPDVALGVIDGEHEPIAEREYGFGFRAREQLEREGAKLGRGAGEGGGVFGRWCLGFSHGARLRLIGRAVEGSTAPSATGLLSVGVQRGDAWPLGQIALCARRAKPLAHEATLAVAARGALGLLGVEHLREPPHFGDQDLDRVPESSGHVAGGFAPALQVGKRRAGECGESAHAQALDLRSERRDVCGAPDAPAINDVDVKASVSCLEAIDARAQCAGFVFGAVDPLLQATDPNVHGVELVGLVGLSGLLGLGWMWRRKISRDRRVDGEPPAVGAAGVIPDADRAVGCVRFGGHGSTFGVELAKSDEKHGETSHGFDQNGRGTRGIERRNEAVGLPGALELVDCDGLPPVELPSPAFEISVVECLAARYVELARVTRQRVEQVECIGSRERLAGEGVARRTHANGKHLRGREVADHQRRDGCEGRRALAFGPVGTAWKRQLPQSGESIGLDSDVLAWIGDRSAALALGTEVGGWIDHASLSAAASPAASMLDVQAAGRGRSGRRARGFSLTCGAGTGVQG
jgi:hypothetical protein